MFAGIREDVASVFARDPAARSTLEVLLCYPGLHAVWIHRAAHALYGRGFRLAARWLSHVARFLTGVEIHPGATIGRRFFIDHGMGVVIGETAEIGDDVTMYHGVTLGGTSWKKEKRHPTIRDKVVIGAGASIIGPVVIGEQAKIGAATVVVTDVAPHTTIVGVIGRVAKKRSPAEDEKRGVDLDHGDLPDPVAKQLSAMLERIRDLEAEVSDLRRTVPGTPTAPSSAAGDEPRAGAA